MESGCASSGLFLLGVVEEGGGDDGVVERFSGACC